MEDYAKYISPKRRAIPTPKALIDNKGHAVFGTFQSEFEDLDLLKAHKATHLPDFLNKWKITLWQATEVHLEEGMLLAVVCDMGVFGKTLNVFYDKRDGKVYTFDTNLPSSKTIIAPNLLKGSVSHGKTDVSEVKYTNLFDRGRCRLQGHHTNKNGDTLEYDFSLSRLSDPSIVSIPFAENRPLYTQKDFLHAKGKLILNGEELHAKEDSVAVMDDHRGFYPRKCHYDWVTTMGKVDIDNTPQFFGLNLTHNQSTDPEKYNENLIWFENKTSLLPPVKFSRMPESKDFQKEEFGDTATWKIEDEHGMVDIVFTVKAMSPMILHTGVINIDYYIAFGILEGYVLDEQGNKYILDGMTGMGEDKTLLF